MLPAMCGGGDAGPNGCGADCGHSGQACCTTAGPACFPGLGCNAASLCDPCFAPLPYPANCKPVVWAGQSASHEYNAETADKADDGNQCDDWNSGNFPPQFWAGRWRCPGNLCPTIAKLGFLTNMVPNGPVTFQLQVGSTVVFGPVTQPMVNGTYYQYDVNLVTGPPPANDGVSPSLELYVTAGPSWVAFNEVVFLTCN
jgi:hypothetical protein